MPPPFRNWMETALAEARAAAARGETPVGAALVDPRAEGGRGAVIARAGNRCRELSDPTAHAEILVIREACAARGSERLPGLDLHVTLEPCPICAGAIAAARIARLYFAAPDPKGGGVDHGPRVFSHSTCHHRPEIYSGMAEDEASALLRAFFRSRRQPGRPAPEAPEAPRGADAAEEAASGAPEAPTRPPAPS